MSLTDTINNTNTQKDNLKTVANNIDNKLVELGGEQAKDLSDVPNKMGAMVSEYLQYASINVNIPIPKNVQIPQVKEETVVFSSEIIKNLNFDSKTEKLFIDARIYTNYGDYPNYDKTVAMILTTENSLLVRFPYYPNEWLEVYIRIKKISNEKSLFEIVGNYYDPAGEYNPNSKFTVNLSISTGFLECYSKNIR